MNERKKELSFLLFVLPARQRVVKEEEFLIAIWLSIRMIIQKSNCYFPWIKEFFSFQNLRQDPSFKAKIKNHIETQEADWDKNSLCSLGSPYYIFNSYTQHNTDKISSYFILLELIWERKQVLFRFEWWILLCLEDFECDWT